MKFEYNVPKKVRFLGNIPISVDQSSDFFPYHLNSRRFYMILGKKNKKITKNNKKIKKCDQKWKYPKK